MQLNSTSADPAQFRAESADLELDAKVVVVVESRVDRVTRR